MKKFTILFGAALLIFFAGSCTEKSERTQIDLPETVLKSAPSATIDTGTSANVSSEKTFQPEMHYSKSYSGMLPCSDCNGIKTTFRISKDFQTYSLTEEFTGKQAAPKTITGNLNTEKGFGKDPNATVYVLNYDQPAENQRYFLRETGKDGQLVQLNRNRRKPEQTQLNVLQEIK